MEDKRAIKTKKAIKEAFIALMDESEFEAITVQDILDMAIINRKTFYKYYRSKYDLAECIAKEFLFEFGSFLDERFKEDESEELTLTAVENAFKDILKGKTRINVIWKIKTDKINTKEEMEKIIRKEYCKLSERYGNSGNVDFQAAIFASFILASYEYIIKSDKIIELNQLLAEYENLFMVISKGKR